ncbi:hypothetical protein ACVFI8_04675 [Agarivorans sp. MS3-6]|uniref:hypothetical protein n=1 Tax=Agarivorans sp. TSD2052 TaxID=2937286 RepID=UPI00200C8256|nr:hypothetical protein [Agarivorans sp. TSD2052]UPW19699.1 hypothetical protein M0C34_05300 [Agarivorans sp. TSD2052]
MNPCKGYGLLFVVTGLLGISSVQAFPKASISNNQQLFAQSIIYHSLTGFCRVDPANQSLSDDFQQWRVSHQQEIKQGREEVSKMATEQQKTMDSVVANLIHVAEQEWGQMQAPQRQQKCQDLHAFLTDKPIKKMAAH